MQSITVVGGGSWATALVKILSNNADTIHWWLRNPETVAFINQYQHNPNYLSDVEIDLKKVIPSANLEECILQSEMILLAIPAAFLKTALSGIHPSIFKDKIVFSAIKGIVPEHNMIVGDYMHKVVDIPYEKVQAAIKITKQVPLHISIGLLIYHRQLERIRTKLKYKPPILGEDWEPWA